MAARIFIIFMPVIIMLISLPLVLCKVPKNSFYGLRTPKAMSGSDEQWYELNREAGIALFIAGSVSLIACVIVPFFVQDPRTIAEICALILGISVSIACGIEVVQHWQ